MDAVPEAGTVEGNIQEAEERLNAEANGDTSLLDRLRARREELQQEHHIDLEIPGYDGLLLARYKPVPWSQAEKSTRKIMKDKSATSKTLVSSVDTLVMACDQIMIKVNDELRPIDPEASPPVRFDERLAKLMGFEASSSREVVYNLFSNDHAIIAQNIQLSRWMTDVTQEADEDFLGE